MTDFVTMGELLIDFTPAGELDGRKLFMQNPGGAVANVAVALSRLGIKSAYMGMVGNDAFGSFLKKVLADEGVDVSGVVQSDEYNTTLAIVHLFDNGQRDFSFYRRPGADIMFGAEMLDEQKIKNARVFHFGSLSMTDEPARSATLRALELAKRAGVTVSYDPNYRAPLWKDEKSAKKHILRGIEYADILKISDNEIDFLFDEMSYESAARMLVSQGRKMVFITMGSEGAIYANNQGSGLSRAYETAATDATGAGDCFTGGVIAQYLLSGKPLESLSLDDVRNFAAFANAAASICVETKGGIPSMPNMQQVLDRMAAQ